MLLPLLALVFVGAATDWEAVSQQFRADVATALDRASWCEAAVSEQIGISVQRLSRQLNGHDPMTFLARAYQLDGFWREFVLIHAERYGDAVVRNTDLRDLLSEVRGLKKSMARMGTPAQKEKVTA